MNKYKISTFLASAMLTGSIVTPAMADDVWPFDVVQINGDQTEIVSYQGLEQAEKDWHICVLFPHMKDSYWVGVNYGIIDQARALGVKVTLLSAGGYTEAAKQVSQYNDCVALGVDAIVIAAISEAGLAKSIAEGQAQGIVQIGVINPLTSDIVNAKIFADYADAAAAGAGFLRELAGDDSLRLVHFPGPQGSGWAESSTAGVERALDGSNIELLEAKYGDTGKSVQLRLVEDAIQAHGDIDVIFGTAVTAEVAPQALEEAGLEGTMIGTFYSNEGIVELVRSGQVTATVTESPVMEARIAVDLAVRVLEGKDYIPHMAPSMTVINQSNIDSIDLSRAFAPSDWDPVFSVD